MTIVIPTEERLHFQGLSAAEVQQRVKQGEVNQFKVRVGRTYWQIIRQNILNVFNIVLFILLLIVLISQDYATVLFAGFSVATTSIIGTVQEIIAKRKLDKLASLTAQRVQVWRDGQLIALDSREIVRDDLIHIRPGDRIAVDGKVIHSDSLEIDESHLTGEADAIYKAHDDPIYSGAFCVAGSGVMIATHVGGSSTVNRLAEVARVYVNTLTPTQQHIATIVQIALIVLLVMGPMVFMAGYIVNNTFLEIVRTTVVFSTSLVPQGLILSTILALTVGAVKISRHQTLIQKINAVESMANVTVLCLDKTGTLTYNRLNVAQIVLLDPAHSDASFHHLLAEYVYNLNDLNSTTLAIRRHLSDFPPVNYPAKQHEIPFSSARQWGAILFTERTLVLGAPERIFEYHPLIASQIKEFTMQGLRVLGFGQLDYALTDPQALPPVKPLGLIIIRDQVREDIRDTVTAFRNLGVRLKVISGDNPETVRAVAHGAGLLSERVFTGEQIQSMSDAELHEILKEVDLFARVQPNVKRRIIEAFRAQGEYVAMVGDGVNDVPALKAAHVAIAMQDGAQISKDVADIVLLNNAISTLPLAFAEGQQITQTIYGTAKMFLTKNVYNTLLFIFVLVMSLPFPITPVQISWGAFGTVNVPAGLMAFGILRPARIRNFREDVLDYILIVGLIGAISIALMYGVTYAYTDGDLRIARSATTLFFMMYGLMVSWNIYGIDILQPRTIWLNPPGLIATSILTGGVLLFASLIPELFEFWLPPPPVIALVMSIFALSAVLASVGLRRRGALHQAYTLFEK